jgi:hypothetical protein
MRRLSVGFRLYVDDVRIWTRAIPVVGAQPIVIERIRSQAGYASTSRIADVQVLVSRHVISKGTIRGDIQAITSRTTNTAPVCDEAVGSHIGCT